MGAIAPTGRSYKKNHQLRWASKRAHRASHVPSDTWIGAGVHLFTYLPRYFENRCRCSLIYLFAQILRCIPPFRND